MENVVFHGLLRCKTIILPILTTSYASLWLRECTCRTWETQTFALVVAEHNRPWLQEFFDTRHVTVITSLVQWRPPRIVDSVDVGAVQQKLPNFDDVMFDARNMELRLPWGIQRPKEESTVNTANDTNDISGINPGFRGCAYPPLG